MIRHNNYVGLDSDHHKSDVKSIIEVRLGTSCTEIRYMYIQEFRRVVGIYSPALEVSLVSGNTRDLNVAMMLLSG